MNYDLIIIGGGPGGYTAAVKAASYGAEVCLIEKENLGGTCLNCGCIPTKAYYKNAEAMRAINDAEEYGICIDSFSFNFARVVERKDKIVKQLCGGIEKLLQGRGVKIIKGEASFQDRNTVEVKAHNGEVKTIKARNIIIAAGSQPIIPPIPGIESEGVLTSKSLLEITELPQSMAVIGGGVIGMEFATIFNTLGAKVKVFEFQKDILPGIDRDITKRLSPLLKKRGLEIHTATLVKEIEKHEDGLVIKAENKKGVFEYKVDKILVSVGRRPSFSDLLLEKVGIEVEDGRIIVNDQYQTNIENIYAVGDINGRLMLAHAASHQAIAAVNKIMGKAILEDTVPIPACVFVFPEIATVGITEEKAKALKLEYSTSKFLFGANGKALTLGEGEGLVKVIADRNGLLLGVHILGPHASDLIHEASLAIAQGLQAADFKDFVHAHPTLSEALEEAVLGLIDEAVHILPKK